MKRLVSILFAIALSVTMTTAALAATVIASGPYDLGNQFSIFSKVGALAPGTYRFTLDLTTSFEDLDYLESDIVKTISDNMYTYQDGLGVVLTGGDDVDQDYTLLQTGPTRYAVDVTVYPDHSVPYPDGGHDDYYETCCSISIFGSAESPGSYTLSYAPVAEPESWALMIAGFGVVGAAMRGARLRRSSMEHPDHIRNTPNCGRSGIGASNVAASASPRTSRVCAGSITPSSHIRAVA